MKKILVTGGSGFLGFSLVKKLAKKNCQIVVYDNDFRGNFHKFYNISKKNIDLVKGDIRDEKKIRKAIKGCEQIYHLAFINGTENFYNHPKLVMDVGILGTANILNISSQNKKIKSFHYASSSEVYHKPKKYPANEKEYLTIPEPQNPRFSYSGSKIIGELLTFNYLKNTNIKHNIFRPHNVFGPEMGFEHVIPQIVKKIYIASKNLKLKKCTIKIQGNGNETRSFCFVDSAVEQIIQIANKGKNKHIYNVGQNHEISIIELIRDISKILGIMVIIKKGKLTKGSVKRRCPDMSKTNKLKYIKNSYHLGLKQTVNWYSQYFLNEKTK